MDEKINLVAMFFGLSNKEYEEKTPLVKRVMIGLYNMDLPLSKEEVVLLGARILDACYNGIKQ